MREEQVPRRQSDAAVTLNGLTGIPTPPELLSNAIRVHHLGEPGPSPREASGLMISRTAGWFCGTSRDLQVSKRGARELEASQTSRQAGVLFLCRVPGDHPDG